MRCTTIDPTNLSAAEAVIPNDRSILMLSLLRWKPEATYSGHPELPPYTGEKAYFQRYIPAFNSIATSIDGIKVSWAGTGLAGLVMPTEEKWDIVALMRYPSFAAFRKIAESREYRENAQHHRPAALEDWRLIATVELNQDPSERLQQEQ
jgi:hypothetical protein